MTLGERTSLARAAARELRAAAAEVRARAVLSMATMIAEHSERILAANAADLEASRASGLKGPMLERLALNSRGLVRMAAALRDISSMPDVVGDVIETTVRPNGLVIRKVREPFGVVGVIYESRPNVTSDVAGLCVKSGNSVILRGGREAARTNHAITAALRLGLEAAGLSPDCIQIVDDPDRSVVSSMMRFKGGIDVLIPRGGQDLIQRIVEEATVPVIETGTGNCHVYVDKAADLAIAEGICMNAKCSNPAVCNAAEKILVHREIARDFVPQIVGSLRKAGVEVKGCPTVRRIVPDVGEATEEDWATEYLDLKIAIKVVDGVHEAISHINRYGTGHSEAIVTGDAGAARLFKAGVDAAAVYVNASTRFTDGGEFGFGAEMGISTQKMHVRGPIGLRDMTTYKYVVEGSGQTR